MQITENSQLLLSREERKQNSFRKAWMQLRRIELQEAREKIMAVLGITTTQQFYKRMRGEISPTLNEVKYINNVFKEYGITEVWGDK